MSARPLQTDRPRMIRAALFGIAAPPILLTAAVLARDIVLTPDWRVAGVLGSAVLPFLVVGAGFSALIFGLFATPLWWLLHRRKARWPHAMLGGAGLGLAAPLAIVLIAGQLQGRLFGALERTWPLIAAGGVIGALTALGMWVIAYRPAPTGEAVAGLFD